MLQIIVEIRKERKEPSKRAQMEMKNHTQLALWPSTQFMTGQRHWKKSDLKT